jgi:peptidoglycan/LPS O-acetylase OafA/YrhL
MRKRILRIVPGFFVAFILSTVAVGFLAPATDHFFRGLDVFFVRSFLLLTGPLTPPVFPGMPFRMVNGAMYTIAYEFRCYLLVALIGLLGLLRRRNLCLFASLVLLSSIFYMASIQRMHWPKQNLFGVPSLTIRLTGIYLVGVCFQLFRDKITFRPLFAVGASAAVVTWIIFLPASAEFAMVLGGGYLMFYWGQLAQPSLSWMTRFPDISYGIYLYGWPVESLWIWFHRGSPWVCFGVSTILCFALGWLSWHFVERPALTLKRTPSAPLPAA